jgi:hypothetical protein
VTSDRPMTSAVCTAASPRGRGAEEEMEMNEQQTHGAIVVELVDCSTVLTKWPCHVCGGSTGRVSVLAEAPGLGLRVCERCLEAGNIDDRLEAYAARLEANARETRALIGRLRVPTYAAWCAAMAAEGTEA